MPTPSRGPAGARSSPRLPASTAPRRRSLPTPPPSKASTATTHSLRSSTPSTMRRRGAELTLVEGAGGLLVPLDARDTIADLVAALGLPLLLVAPNALGALSHVLAAAESSRERGIELRGVVLVDVPEPDLCVAHQRAHPGRAAGRARVRVPAGGEQRRGACPRGHGERSHRGAARRPLRASRRLHVTTWLAPPIAEGTFAIHGQPCDQLQRRSRCASACRPRARADRVPRLRGHGHVHHGAQPPRQGLREGPQRGDRAAHRAAAVSRTTTRCCSCRAARPRSSPSCR